MRHQAMLFSDGFECSCGLRPKYRRDADPQQIRDDLRIHQEKQRPTKDEITKLIASFQEWERKIDAATIWHPGEPMRMRQIPDPPAELLSGVREVIIAFEWVRFPVLQELVTDPGGPHIKDVVNELAEARELA